MRWLTASSAWHAKSNEAPRTNQRRSRYGPVAASTRHSTLATSPVTATRAARCHTSHGQRATRRIFRLDPSALTVHALVMVKQGPHRLFVTVPVEDVPVAKKDVVFFIYRGKGKRSAKFGELRVSQGALVWRGSRDQKGRKLGWDQLARLLEEHGRRAETRKPGEKKSVSRRKRT